MQTQTVNSPPAAGVWRRRLAVVAGAVVATVLLYLILTATIGELSAPEMNGQAGAELNAGMVFVVSGLVSLLAWALLAVLERFTGKARIVWTVAAAGVLVLSMGGPLAGDGIEVDNRIGLVLLHVVVAAVLIPLLPAQARLTRGWQSRSDR